MRSNLLLPVVLIAVAACAPDDRPGVDLPDPADESWTGVAVPAAAELAVTIVAPSVVRLAADADSLDAVVAYGVAPEEGLSAERLVYGWNGAGWEALAAIGLWRPQVHSAFAVNSVGSPVRLVMMLASSSGGEWQGIIEGFGEGDIPDSLTSNAQSGCRIKLQCRRAAASENAWTAFGLGMLSDTYHCGWFTRIPGTSYLRLGTDVQGGFHLKPASGGVLDFDAYVRAVRFARDQGYRDLDSQYQFTPFDSEEPFDYQTLGGTDAAVCEKAGRLRVAAWEYAARNPRPYDITGQADPNSNSFLGALAVAAGFHPRPDVPDFDDEGDYLGWHYWQKAGRDWRKYDR